MQEGNISYFYHSGNLSVDLNTIISVNQLYLQHILTIASCRCFLAALLTPLPPDHQQRLFIANPVSLPHCVHKERVANRYYWSVRRK